MATFWVCPINGMLPADNGTDQTKVNNVVPSESDAVVTASTVIGAATNPGTVIVTTGANFAVGDVLWIPTRGEKLQVLSKSTNTLTCSRGFAGTPISSAIAIADVILTGFDVNGNPPHCPLCGSAMQVMDPAKVTTQTGVAAGSQHPVDADAVYVTSAFTGTNFAGEGQGTAVYTTGAKFTAEPLLQHAFAALNRGTATVTASTLNTTVGP
jgi:hypothetical protein